MSNAIPLLEGTDASGGYLVPVQLGDILQNTIYRESAVASLSKRERLVGKRETFPVYAGRPTAAFVSEGAAKPITGASYEEIALNTKKIATNVIYTQELLEDARIDPRVLVNADVEGAFSDLIDVTALSGSTFDNKLTATTQEAATKPSLKEPKDSIAKAVSEAMKLIELNGGKPNGIVASGGTRGLLRDARGTESLATVPVYTAGFEREPDSLYGLNIAYSSNLETAKTKVLAIVGDFTHAILGIRQDLTVRFSDQASLVTGTTVEKEVTLPTVTSLWQENKVASQWEMRVGFQVHDINRMFVKIVAAE